MSVDMVPDAPNEETEPPPVEGPPPIPVDAAPDSPFDAETALVEVSVGG